MTVLKHTVEQLDAVREQLEDSATDQEREILLEQEALLERQVGELVPDPSSRKATGSIGAR